MAVSFLKIDIDDAEEARTNIAVFPSRKLFLPLASRMSQIPIPRKKVDEARKDICTSICLIRNSIIEKQNSSGARTRLRSSGSIRENLALYIRAKTRTCGNAYRRIRANALAAFLDIATMNDRQIVRHEIGDVASEVRVFVAI